MNGTAVLDRGVDTLAAVIAEFIDVHGELLFYNHGDWEKYGDLVSLNQMAESVIARSNCYRASCFVMDLMEDSDDFGGEQLHVFAVASDEDYHAALAVRFGNQWQVIDFTARQFDPELPFPYVAPMREWKARIEEAFGCGSDFCADASDMATAGEQTLWFYQR